MTNSNKILLIIFSLIFLLIGVKNREINEEIRRDDWETYQYPSAIHNVYNTADSIQVETLPPHIKWYELDFKNSKSPITNIRISIFDSIGMSMRIVYPRIPYFIQYTQKKYGYSPARYWDMVHTGGPYYYPLSKIIGGMTIILTPKAPDMNYLNFRAEVNVFKKNQVRSPNFLRSDRADFYNKSTYTTYFQHNYYNSEYYYPSMYYEVEYKSSRSKYTSTYCRWEKGLWITHISIQGYNDIDIDKKVAIRNQIRDCIFNYYKQINYGTEYGQY